jgi:hypothetical protein
MFNPNLNDQMFTQNPQDQTIISDLQNPQDQALGPYLQDQMLTTYPNDSAPQPKSESGCQVQNRSYDFMLLWFLLILSYGIVNKQRVIGTATSLRTYK